MDNPILPSMYPYGAAAGTISGYNATPPATYTINAVNGSSYHSIDATKTFPAGSLTQSYITTFIFQHNVE